jgi:hypothetical protein
LASSLTSRNSLALSHPDIQALKHGVPTRYDASGMEEFVETFNRTSNQTIDLFKKPLRIYQATSVTEAQHRVQVLIESSLTALQVNVHSALNTNAKIIASWESWNELSRIV